MNIWPVIGCTVLVALLVWGHHVDSDAALADALAAAHEAGRQLGRLEMAETVADAYSQGRRDVVLAGGRP